MEDSEGKQMSCQMLESPNEERFFKAEATWSPINHCGVYPLNAKPMNVLGKGGYRHFVSTLKKN